MTPNCSPPSSHPTTPVIVLNPNFLPPPPLLPRYSPYHPNPVLPPKPPLGSRLPPPSGRWDNTTTTPSYHKPDAEFWSTRQLPIPILSTVSSALSGLGFTPGSGQSSEVFEEGQLELVDLANSEMPGTPSDSDDAAEAERLRVIRETIEYKISRLKPDKIKISQVDSAKQKLNDILVAAEQYGIGITALTRKPGLEESFRLQYKADLTRIEESVDDIEDKVCDKIHQLQLSSQPSVSQPGIVPIVGPTSEGLAGGQDQGVAQAASASMIRSATIAKAVVKYKALIDLALQTTQDMETDGLYLETATNERVQKLVMKISKYEKVRDQIKADYLEYLQFTAVDKPDNVLYDPKKLDEAVDAALKVTDSLIRGLEKQDDERQLGTLLPRKTEKVNWPHFSGKPGESFFKFKEQFLKAARQNQTN